MKLALPIAALLLAGCAASPTPDDGLVHIVASTDVYGDIAAAIGGNRVTVTSIIDDPAQDPHSFEGNARVQLALSRADIVIENGGGYDDFVGTLLAGAGNPDVVVLDAVELSQGNGANEHVWYDFGAMGALADALVAALAVADPASRTVFERNGEEFAAELDELQTRVVALREEFEGTAVAITEPVPGYLLDALGLVNVTPVQFTKAIEEGTDVAPTVFAETLALFADHTAQLLVYNEQSTGPETQRVLRAADAAGTPVVPVTETLPAGQDYPSWMSSNIDAIAAALS
jgi:zinc/manganese transport system substrate-binding protein